ncbi:hypothetical protein SAY87_008265 [Trapa incisa]|uniref:Uncharacterized protein n=1 Tax=Trapa incisa TaxID=236973 RepID=A0AAN7QGJ7_9MYRT|nr:hypothetical protein SAY87_008265 [Trapa incisa]
MAWIPNPSKAYFEHRQVQRLQKELEAANADLIRYACNADIPSSALQPAGTASMQPILPPVNTRGRHPAEEFAAGSIGEEHGGGFFQPPPYSLPWDANLSGDINQWRRRRRNTMIWTYESDHQFLKNIGTFYLHIT